MVASKNLAQGLLEELRRCRDLLKMYEDIGQPGFFAASMLKIGIEQAEDAQANGDVIQMLKSYEELKEYE